MSRSYAIIKKLYSFEGKFNSVSESILIPEVEKALSLFVKNFEGDFLLIGGLALAYYARPRSTMDVDLLFITDRLIPTTVNGFKKVRPHSFEHTATGVEIKVLSPEYLNLPPLLVNKVFETSKILDGIKIPSKEGLVALKLMRSKLKDLGDIESILENHDIDLSQWPIPKDKIEYANSVLSGRKLLY